MLSDKPEVAVYDNDELRNQWEQRSQMFSNRDKQEKDRKGKSALNGLFKEWHVRLAMRTGMAATVEKNKGDLSDFRKYVVTAGGEAEIDIAKLEAQFKVKPPPKIAKPAPPPPPPPKKKPAPKPAPKAPRKPEVDILKMCWGDSWKCLKPPRQQHKAVEKTPSEPKQTDMKTYKPIGYDLEATWGSAATDWIQSWKQIKSPAQMELSKENKSQWDILSKGKFWRRYETEIENFSLPMWAGTWKTINFLLGQDQSNWDRSWPDYERNASDKLTKLQHLEQEDHPSDWADSWKSSKAELQPEDDTKESMTSTSIKMEIPNVFLPGWNESWMSSGVPLENGEECHKNWQSSWGYCQEHRWCKASLESRHRHIDMLMRRRRNKNLLLASGLEKEVPDTTEWEQSWKTPKAYSEVEEEGEMQDQEDYNEEQCEYEVPAHLQFHKLNASYPTWKESWMVSKAHRAEGGEGGEGEEKVNPAWKRSWKLCDSEQGVNNTPHLPSQGDVVYFSAKHKTRRYMGVEHVEDGMKQNQWSESWKAFRGEEKDNLRLQLSFLSKEEAAEGNKKMIDPKLSASDWNESLSLKPDIGH